MTFAPRFTISHPITAALTRIERACGFLEAAKLSEDWIRRMGARALVLEAHHEGTRLTLEQAERLWAGERVPEADPDDARELLNYRAAFDFVSQYLGSGGPILRQTCDRTRDDVGRMVRLLRTMRPATRPRGAGGLRPVARHTMNIELAVFDFHGTVEA